jgi:hypothetical protein
MTVHGYARVSAEQTFDNRPIVRPTSTLLKHVRGYYAGDQPNPIPSRLMVERIL